MKQVPSSLSDILTESIVSPRPMPVTHCLFTAMVTIMSWFPSSPMWATICPGAFAPGFAAALALDPTDIAGQAGAKAPSGEPSCMGVLQSNAKVTAFIWMPCALRLTPLTRYTPPSVMASPAARTRTVETASRVAAATLFLLAVVMAVTVIALRATIVTRAMATSRRVKPLLGLKAACAPRGEVFLRLRLYAFCVASPYLSVVTKLLLLVVALRPLSMLCVACRSWQAVALAACRQHAYSTQRVVLQHVVSQHAVFESVVCRDACSVQGALYVCGF